MCIYIYIYISLNHEFKSVYVKILQVGSNVGFQSMNLQHHLFFGLIHSDL